jgi:protein TonB
LLISQYGIRLRSETQRQAKYPAVGRREGWEGRGELLLVVGEDGRVAELKLVRSSGHTLLDRALIEGVRRAQSRVEIPAGLQGRRFQLELPFVMNLVNE